MSEAHYRTATILHCAAQKQVGYVSEADLSTNDLA